MFCFSVVCMYCFIGVGVRNSIDIMHSATLGSPAWTAARVILEMQSIIGMVAGVTANFRPFCSKDFLQVLVPSWRG